MPKEKKPKSVSDFLALLPLQAKLRETVICDGHAEDNFFDDFKNANIVSISVLRYGTFDVVAFITDDRRAITVVGKKRSFIALEKRNGQDEEGQEMALGFRDDISHRRLSIIESVVEGRNVTYGDLSYAPNNVIGIDPASDFVQLAFKDGPVKKGFRIDNVRPSRYTEDWFRISQANFESLTLRADRNALLGVFAISGTEIKPLQFGNRDLGSIRLNQPPQGILASKILPLK